MQLERTTVQPLQLPLSSLKAATSGLMPGFSPEILWGGLYFTAIVGLWSFSLWGLLAVGWEHITPWGWVLVMGGRTFLHTGLFILGHDAIHGTLIPGYPRWNHGLGRLVMGIYACLPYDALYQSHWQHHRNPAQTEDPDYHAPHRGGLWSWYLQFMTQYLINRQSILPMVLIALIFHSIRLGFHVSALDLILFWVVPSFLSTFQLFFFGTYLPHREPPEGHVDQHRAKSINYPIWLSLLTCYHFGYHWEHHAYPGLPWYRLPGTCARSSMPKNWAN